MFLCRENELRKLEHRYGSGEMECIVIYGRRRVGKTALINEFSKDKPTIFFPALRSNAQGNLTALSKAIYNYDHPDAIEAPTFATFDAAFTEITRIAKNERVVFVIDEFPYLVKSDPSVTSRLQHLLDHDWQETKLYLILCGSSMSFMEKKVLSEKSPLFGRRTAQFKIEPLSYMDAARFHPELSPEENAVIYGITGGVPHYINKLGVRGSVKDALLENFFDTSSYLFEEPENLLKQELREPAIYNSIIAAIAEGATRLNQISDRTGNDTPTCTKYLKSLMELGIVQKRQPIIQKSSRKTTYHISDHFFRFWYRFVPGNMMAISSDNMARIYGAAVDSYLSSYIGLVFEDICKQYLTRYAEHLPIQIRDIGEWWGADPQEKKEAQLDIVALGTKPDNTSSGRQFIIGSCKFKSEPIGTDELDLIKHYASLFTSAHDTCYYYIFSKSDFTAGLLDKAQQGEVTLVSLKDIYQTPSGT
jgi:AAA+ ATPase superfamily predicted ATPase